MKIVALATTVLLLSAAAAPAADTAARPNVVVFLVDDMGVMDTAVPFLTDEAGRPKRYPLNEFYRTPNMDRLAKRGIRFNNCCAMSVCSPTRVSILTGQNAARHHTTNWINPDRDNRGPLGPPDWNWRGLGKNDVTLPRLLQRAGYRTIHVGKGHFGCRDSEGAEPKNLGFDVNIAGCSIGAPASYYGMENYDRPPKKAMKNRRPAPSLAEPRPNQETATASPKRAPNAVSHLEKYHGTETFLTEALTLEARAQVADAVQAGKPFFLYLAHYAVHAPFNSDPRFAAHYADSGKPSAAQAFATLIEGMDKSLGDLLDELERLGVAENTCVFFLGDNGSDAPLGGPHEVACAAPLRGKKGSHYEGGMRVPLIAAWVQAAAENPHQQRLPIAAGEIQTQQVAVYDLFPTILALTGIAPPEKHIVDGARLDTLLTGRRDSAREEVFLMHYPHAPHRSDYFTCYRRDAWKVIYHYFPSPASEESHYQLYNLAADPFESRNLAASQPDQLQRMMQGLAACLERHNALYPVDQKDGVTPLEPQLPQTLSEAHR